MQRLLHRIHPLLGGLAILCIASFMVSTIVSELSENPLTIAATKQAILWGLLVLVPCLAFTGLSGYQIAGKAPRGLMLTKFKRMRVIGIDPAQAADASRIPAPAGNHAPMVLPAGPDRCG